MTTMQKHIHKIILPHLHRLVQQILAEREDMTLDGVRVFDSGDRFVPGKIINGASYLMTMGDGLMDQRTLQELIAFTAPMYIETWGYMNYLQGLYRLKQANLLTSLLDGEREALLKKQLDWRNFVNEEDLSLINKPTNYYGVAFGVARYRELLGWESGNYSQQLFDKLLAHIMDYSGQYLFMDETPGEGRFDRYSILIAGEICSLLKGTGMAIPHTLKKMLEQSAAICLQIANKEGHGIAYGRSIGAYGDTAVLEILSIAAELDILSKEQKALAFGYATKIVEKFTGFWIDEGMGSINMWEKGRSTDRYRHKGRILGENFSLSCQILHTYHQWVGAGMTRDIGEEVFDGMLQALAPVKQFTFAKDIYERGLVVVRDGGWVFMLPLINGGGGTAGDVHGQSYYFASPYLPIPQGNRLIEAQPDSHFPVLMPKVTMADGSDLMSVAYMKDIRVETAEDGHHIAFCQDLLCKVGERYPQEDRRGTSTVEYVFGPGTITRREALVFTEVPKFLEMVFFSFGEGEGVAGGSRVTFKGGPIKAIEVSGLVLADISLPEDLETANTSHQALKSQTSFHWHNEAGVRELNLSWTLHY